MVSVTITFNETVIIMQIKFIPQRPLMIAVNDFHDYHVPIFQCLTTINNELDAHH